MKRKSKTTELQAVKCGSVDSLKEGEKGFQIFSVHPKQPATARWQF